MKEIKKTGDETTQISTFVPFPPKKWIDKYYETNKMTLPKELKYIAVTTEMTNLFMKELRKENE